MKISLEKGDFTELQKLAVAFMNSAKGEDLLLYSFIEWA